MIDAVKLLQLLESDCTLKNDQLAAMLGVTEAEVEEAIQKLRDERIILGKQAVIDWDRTQREAVTALIEVKVESVYLMSGAYDLTVIISGRSLKEVAHFVGEKLAVIEDVTGTATHFILRKYKEKHIIFEKRPEQEKEWIFV